MNLSRSLGPQKRMSTTTHYLAFAFAFALITIIVGNVNIRQIYFDSTVNYNDYPFHQEGNATPNYNVKNANDVIFSGCLLIKDMNHLLPEWLAYHYTVLPMHRLILAVDPVSVFSFIFCCICLLCDTFVI